MSTQAGSWSRKICWTAPVEALAQKDVVGILQAIEMLDGELVGAFGPFHAGDVIVTRVAGDGHPFCFAALRADDADAYGGIGGSRNRIRNIEDRGIDADSGIRKTGDDFLGRAEIVNEFENSDVAGIELPVGDTVAVGTPTETVADVEFFFVDPIGSAVDDGGGAVARDLGHRSSRDIFNIDIIGADVGDLRAVRREFREHQGRWRGVAAKLAQGFCAEVEDPVIAAGVASPDLRGIGVEEDLRFVFGQEEVLEFKRGLFVGRDELRGGDEDLAFSGGGFVANDVSRVFDGGGGFDGGVRGAVIEPAGWAEVFHFEIRRGVHTVEELVGGGGDLGWERGGDDEADGDEGKDELQEAARRIANGRFRCRRKITIHNSLLGWCGVSSGAKAPSDRRRFMSELKLRPPKKPSASLSRNSVAFWEALARGVLVEIFNSLFCEMAFFNLPAVLRLNGAGVIWVEPGESGNLRGRSFDGSFQDVPFNALATGRSGERAVEDIIILIAGEKIGGVENHFFVLDWLAAFGRDVIPKLADERIWVAALDEDGDDGGAPRGGVDVNEVEFHIVFLAVDFGFTRVMEMKLDERQRDAVDGDAAAGRVLDLDGMAVVEDFQRRELVIEMDGSEIGRLRVHDIERRLMLAGFAAGEIGREIAPMVGAVGSGVGPVRFVVGVFLSDGGMRTD